MKAFQATFLRIWLLAMAVALLAALPAAAQAPPPPAPKPTPSPEGPPPVRATVPIRFYANVYLRQDFTDLEDRTDLLLDGNNVDGLLTRLRFGMEFKDEKSTVSGGIRVSAGEAPNPASPFVRLGNAFRPVTFGLDQFYVNVRPFANKERLLAVFGKMPQPFWRGDKGLIRDEMVWDDDISPVGAVLQLQLYKSQDGQMRLENTAGYFIAEWFRQDRFAGLVGDTSLWGDQLTLKFYALTLAGAYYHWQNLNSGARAPSFMPGDSAFLLPGQSAFLLRSGFQVTNAHYDLGSGVAVFRENEFDLVEATAQLAVPIKLPLLGKTELVALGYYSANGSVGNERDGVGGSVGLVGGDLKKRLKPYSVWGTWRRVKADAALGTFADSDLGAGTDVEGFEVTGDLKVHKNLSLTASFFEFEGAPNRTTDVRRIFLGMIWDF